MADTESHRYLVIVTVSDTRVQRLQVVVPFVKDVLTRIASKGVPVEQLFRSMDGGTFAYLIRSAKKAGQIVAAIESPGSGLPAADQGAIESPPLDGKDRVCAIEIGDDFSGPGLGRCLAWLQNR